jgi:hypothetical protein
MPGLLQGLVEGFRGRADETYTRNLEQDAARRTGESRLYDYLLSSRDPQIRALALHGLYQSTQPSARKRGFSGLMGELETSSVYPSIQALAEQLIPESTAPTGGPVAPGSAALPAQAAVEPGAPAMPAGLGVQGPQIPEEPPVLSREPGAAPELEAAGPPPEMPAAQAQAPSRFKRRGTQVPTAEEIAEYQARIPLETRMGIARANLPPEMAQEAIMGILGAPRRQTSFGTPNFSVRLPSGEIVPVSRDNQTGQLVMMGPGGQMVPIPPGSTVVRTTAAGGSVSSTVQDTPEIRAEYGIPGDEPNPQGWWRIQQRADGSVLFLPAPEPSTPPAYSGTTVITEPGTNVPVRAPILRGGGVGPALGDEPDVRPTQAQQSAQGLLAAVDAQIRAAQVGPGGLRRQVTSQQMDQITKQAAIAQGLPYQSYTELQIASRVQPETSPRQRQEPGAGMSIADRIRQRAIQGQAPAAPPPPAAPSARSQGAGPRR